MAVTTPCPATYVLQRLLLGDLPPAVLETVTEHVLHCDRCAGTLNGMCLEDPLLKELHGAKSVLAPHPTTGSLVERMCKLSEGARAVGAGEPMLAPTPFGGAGIPVGWAFDLMRMPTLVNQLNPLLEMRSTVDDLRVDSEVAALKGQPVIEGYKLLALLGRGGMGVVYKARHVALNRVVALKMILAGPHAGPDLLARFKTEAEAIARLQHPNIVQVHEVGEHEGRPYFSLEFCAGGSLSQKLRGTPMPPKEAAPLAETLARAMHAAHQAHIIHRDLKPANVLLTAEGTPKITDFGLAKKMDEAGQTHTGDVMGTPSYMAPEQAAGKNKEIGPATDVYALGAMLYEFLTGRPPFKAATSLDTILQVQYSEPVAVRQLQPKVPRDLETICLKCLQKLPAKRYTTALQLAEDLRRFQAGEPILARPVGPLERGVRWVRRRPVVASLAVASVLLLAVFVFAVVVNGLYQAEQARYQTQQANIFREKAERLEQSEQDRKKIEKQWLEARKRMSEGKWVEAQTELVAAQHALEVQHDLQAEDLKSEITQSLKVVIKHVHEDQVGQQAHARSHELWKAYDDAWFHETLSTGLKPMENRDRAGACARAALALYRLDRAPVESEQLTEGLKQDQRFLGRDEYAQVVRACYELLLIWAEAESSILPEEAVGPDRIRQRALRGLAVLGRAEQVGRAYGLDTRAFHRRRALYLARSRGEKFDAANITTGPHQPAGALDWFLRAMDSYRAGQIEEASLACGQVLRRQEGHFWAHYLRGLCGLRTGQWLEAHAELSICLNLKKHVWPVLLRGFAASERGNQLRQAVDTGACQLAASTVAAAPQLGTALPALAAAVLLAARPRPGAAEFAQARDDFDRALATADLDPQARYVALVNRGTLLIRERKWDEACIDLVQATQLNPKAYQAHFNLAMALQGARHGREALAALDQAIACEPGMDVLYSSRAVLQSDPALARADLERAVDASSQEGRPERLANNQVQLGRLLLTEGKHQEALASFERALLARPDFLVAQRFLAEALLALGRSAEAGRALDRYLEQSRQPAPEVLLSRGLIHARAGQLPQAIEMFSAKLRLTPRDTLTRSDRGWTYLQTDALQLALQDFELCLQEQPNNADFLIGRGVARIRTKQWADALADAEKAEKQGRLTDRHLYNLACLYAQAGVHGEARARRESRASQYFVHYFEKALDCLARSLEPLSEAKRAAFWRKQVQVDPLLGEPLRRERAYLLLAARYGSREL